ncbi:Nonribosomal peptide synthetase [Tolypocladium capitatum]|uniref:Nonribosomal peptide synthetase n=1 Tax=Tolypocladium capitatum TaxID=45235 RepID=A0A2K3QBY7_9HYPO|nr:Nonribosomal peptide synthetase [Tolypocladium capitatum]
MDRERAQPVGLGVVQYGGGMSDAASPGAARPASRNLDISRIPRLRMARSQESDLFEDLSNHKELDDFLKRQSELFRMGSRAGSPPMERTGSELDCDTYTTATPVSTPYRRHSGVANSVLKYSGGSESPSSSSGDDDVFIAIDAEAAAFLERNSPNPPSRPSSGADVDTNDSARRLKDLLLSISSIGKVCLIAPRAGPFEGQFVALITAAAAAGAVVYPPDDDEISLIPEPDHDAGRHRIHELRTAVLEWGGDSPRPDVWIILRSMAMNGQGEPDARRLQTWVQNITDEIEGQIMGMQVFRARRSARRSTRSPVRSVRPKSAHREDSEATDHVAESPHTLETQLGEEDAWADVMEFFPLSVMQQIFFRTTIPRGIESAAVSGPGFRFSQSILLRVKGGSAELADVEAAIAVLTSRHSMLRARFRWTGEGWAQAIAPASTGSYWFEHKYADGDDDILVAVEQARGSLDIFKGPVFAAQHIRTQGNGQLLYLVAHHLVVDLVSWRILLHDLDELLQEGALVSEASMPFTGWTDYQSFENGQRLVEPILPFDVGTANLGYWNLEQCTTCYGDAQQLSFSLTADVATALRTTCNEVFRTESSDIFMAALLHSFYQTFPDRDIPTVWKQEHGREANDRGFNIDETVGWFTTLCPLSVPTDTATDLVQLIKLIKDTRKAIPRSGTPFFASRFSASRASSSPIPVEVMFNCVDTLRQLERKNGILEPIAAPDRVTNSPASDVGPEVGRIALFDVSVVVDELGARVEFLYNAGAAHQSHIASWVGSFEYSVLEAVGRLRGMDHGLTLADAPLLEASYDGLSKLALSRLAAVGLDGVTNVETMCPVGPVQQDMLIAQGRDPDAFHVSGTYELVTPDGRPADQGRLCAAWEALVGLYASLRSIFIDSVSDKGLFDQVVLRKTSPAMLFVDSADPVQTLASVPAMQVVPSQPRHRLSVCRSSTKTYLRLDASQALCDPTSIHNLVSQLRRAYAGKEVHVGDPPSPRLHRHVSFLDSPHSLERWRANLAGAEPCVFPRLALQHAGRMQTRGFDLDVDLGQLSRFCASGGLEPSTVVKLAWALVLRAFVAEDRVTFGHQLCGRAQTLVPDLSQAVGSFAAVLPCLVDFSRLQTVHDALQHLEKLSRDARKSEVPALSEIEHALRIRGASLFNSCISFQDMTSMCAEEIESDAEPWEPALVASSLDANCELSLCVNLLGDRLRGDITYQFLGPDQARNIVNSFERAVQIILDAPAQRVSGVDLFTDHDYTQIMAPDWDPTKTDTKTSACIHELIIHQARRRPHATAVSSWDGDLSYQQVEAFVTKLAAYLVNLGVGPGALVPVVLEKCRWSPIIMLAVLQAGGCFVALDSQDVAMVDATIRQLDAQMVLVTDSAWKHVSPIVRDCILINQMFLNALPPQVTLMVDGPVPEQAACAFLSPGQGRPRGMFFTHQSLCSILSVQGPALRIGDRSRVLQLSAFNVDIALVEVLGTLLHGGCVCIPSAPERTNDLQGVIARMAVTWSYMTSVFARKIDPSMVPNLKTVCFRTRSLDEETYGPWLHNRDVLLAYGAPDVCPLAISVLRISGPREASVIAPPLVGRFLILNPDDPKKMVPVGAVGELAIDSSLVTPHKFVPGRPLVDAASLCEPQSKQKWRYLRTGHRARYLDYGHVRFLGSMRDEASGNGSPAAMGEIERQIRLCLARGVDVTVEPIRTSDSAYLLAAFLDFGDDPSRGPYDLSCIGPELKLRLFAARKAIENSLGGPDKSGKRLPRQHIPAVFVPVRGFPLSASLKVNRRRLQKMAASMSHSQLSALADGQYAGRQPPALEEKPLPLTMTELSMRLVWAAVLGVVAAGISPSDSFLDAGGDKLLAARLVVSCRQSGFDVSIQDVLRGATLTDICRSVSAAEEVRDRARGHKHHGRPSANGKKSLNPHHGLIKLVLAPQIEVPWHDVTDAAEASSQQVQSLESSLYSPRGDINCLVLDFNGPVRPQRLESACSALTEIHPILRTAFAIHECRVYQVSIASFKAEFKHQPCPARSLGAVAERVMQQDRGLPLRLGQPVTGFTFLEDGQQGKLIVRLSAAQVSESAAPQLVQDLIKLYEDPKAVRQRPSFLEYSRAVRDARYADGVKHWRKRLAGAAVTRVAPYPKPHGPAADRTTLHETIEVSPLSEFGISFDTALKAAWAMALASLTGDTDVVFGELVDGRSTQLESGLDVSAVAGPMERTVPVRIRFPVTHTSPLQMMQHIQRDAAASLPYEGIGAQSIIRECTDWPRWTKFSTVVRHRPKAPVDGSTTLNIADTTFTYDMVESPARDVPDLFAASTTVGPGRVALALSFSAGRVPGDLAEAAMGLLVGAVKTLACYETISQPLLPPASDYRGATPRLPLDEHEPAAAGEGGGRAGSASSWLSRGQRKALRGHLASAWNETLNPAAVGMPEEEIQMSRFYDISGSLVPAYLFADRINRGLRKLETGGSGTLRVTPEEVVRHPTLPAQGELIAGKMRDLGIVTKPSRGRTLSLGQSATTSLVAAAAAARMSSTSSKTSSKASSWSLVGRDSSRKHDSTGSMRDLGARAGGWMRHHVSLGRDKAARRSGSVFGRIPEAAEMGTGEADDVQSGVGPLSVSAPANFTRSTDGSESPGISSLMTWAYV